MDLKPRKCCIFICSKTAIETISGKPFCENHRHLGPEAKNWPSGTASGSPPRAASGQIQESATAAAFRDAIEGMEDMLPYVDEYFRKKWDHQGYIDRAKAFLSALEAATRPGEASEPEKPLHDTPLIQTIPAFPLHENPPDPVVKESLTTAPVDPEDIAHINAVFRSPHGEENWYHAGEAWKRIKAALAEGEP